MSDDDRCRTCVWWTPPDEKGDKMANPVDPDTYEPMKFDFEVRLCEHPDKTFRERPLTAEGFGLMDGSGYMANLYTAENFGCVLHEHNPHWKGESA